MWIETFSCSSHAVSAKKCTKKHDAHAKLFFSSIKLLLFLMFLLLLLSLLLKLPVSPDDNLYTVA